MSRFLQYYLQSRERKESPSRTSGRSSRRESKSIDVYSDLSLLSKKTVRSKNKLPKGHYEVGHRLMSKREKDGKLQYLVKWTGYSIDESTWEPLKNLTGPAVKDMVKKMDAKLFEAALKARKRKSAAATSSGGKRKAQSASGGKSKAKKQRRKTGKSSDGGGVYEVEKIIKRRRQHGQFEYLVKWLGYPLYECTWEPLVNLSDVMDLVRECDKCYD